MTHRVFISYSHADATLVTPVVGLLRATKDFVFLDADTIRPGQKWRAEISEALANASLVVVFWCRHSSVSAEVEAEYRAAMDANKDILPVLLDSTPVTPPLRDFQWIDFRQLAGGNHPIENLPPMADQPQMVPSAAPRHRFRETLGVAIGVAVPVLIVAVLLQSRGIERIAWLIIGIAALVAGVFGWLLLRPPKASYAIGSGREATATRRDNASLRQGREKEMSATLESAIRQRLTIKPDQAGRPDGVPSSVQQAIAVSDIREEYEWIANHRPGFSVDRQSLEQISGRWYDVITVRNAEDEVQTIYFDISSFYPQ